MKTLKIGVIFKTEIKLYQDIDETPIDQYNFFNEYCLMDVQIGNTMADVDKRHTNLATLIAKKKTEEALQTLNNLYQTYWSAINKINHKSLCFGCMIHSVDGKEITDYSTESLHILLDYLAKKGLKMKHVKEEVDNLKKNFKSSSN
jgi:hypothetical protein